MAVKVRGVAQKGNFVQKPSSRQRQHASMRIAELLARFLHYYRATHLHSQNEMDKASSRNSVRCLAWWRAVRHAVFFHRPGNVNTQVCVLTRAKLDLLRFYRATHLHFQNEMDKDLSRNSVRCLAWWRAVRHAVFFHRQGNGNTQTCVLPMALLGFCTATAQSLVCSQIKLDKNHSSTPHDRLLGEACYARCLHWRKINTPLASDVLLGGVPFGTLFFKINSFFLYSAENRGVMCNMQ